MEYKTISKADFRDFVNRLIQGDREINGVVTKGTGFIYDTLEDAADLCLDYDETLLPPKKYFLPVKETLLTFKTGDPSSYHESVEATPRIVIGIHPWDLAAIALLDKAFSTGQSDVNYLSRRNQSLLVGIYPTRPFKHRFSGSMITDEHYQTADLMLVDMGDDVYAIEVVSDEGRALLRESAAVTADEHTIESLEIRKHVIQDEVHLSMPKKDLPAFLQKQQQSKVIDRRADRCFSCGACVLVCPTCYCFHVEEEVDLSLQAGRRTRSWDGCMMEGFASAAGGHNFRETPANRLRHRILRKGRYLPEHFHLPGCVGCGRCAEACVAGIASPLEIINEMNRSIYLPEVATLQKIDDMSEPILPGEYERVTNEYVDDRSTAKWTRFNRGSYAVGALARFNNNHCQLTDAAKAIAGQLGLQAPCYNPFMNSVAQVVECVFSVQKTILHLEWFLDKGLKEEDKGFAVREGRGVGAVDVPRGTLFHDYIFDRHGKCVEANLVIPTNQNHANIQADMETLVPLIQDMPAEKMQLTLEMLVRAYDPCISCSTHCVDLRA